MTDSAAAADPIARFSAWMAEAERGEPNDPNAVCLATCTPEGRPSARMVLLKGVDARGFVFYTNLESRKGGELLANPHAALCFHWKSLQRSVRVEGAVERVSDAEADAYYASRARGSRIGAWASRQSRPLDSKAALMAEAAKVAARHPLNPPRPPHWGGFRIRPVEIEFWADGAFRMHDRFRWTRAGVDAADWTVTRLNP
jgi:pyridoxamine 5'-phosphate oxidase